MNWIGAADTPHEFVFVPDAMAAVARLATFEAAYGEHWIVGGAGGITGRQVAEIAGRALGRRVGLRAAGPLLLRIVSLFKPELRGFMQMVPDYVKPITYDGSRLRGLIGETAVTPYEEGIRETLRSLGSR